VANWQEKEPEPEQDPSQGQDLVSKDESDPSIQDLDDVRRRLEGLL